AAQGDPGISEDGNADDWRRGGDGRPRRHAGEDRGLLRGGSGHGGGGPADAARAGDDRGPRRHRRGHRDRDVSADIRSDLEADIGMLSTELRRRVGWLIVVRAVLSTVLLGSATFMQVRAPGSDAFDPFFLLIGLIFALTIPDAR